MSKFKSLTHWIASGVMLVGGWAVTHPDQVINLIRTVPKLAFAVPTISALLLLYHSPLKPTSK